MKSAGKWMELQILSRVTLTQNNKYGAYVITKTEAASSRPTAVNSGYLDSILQLSA